MTFQAAGYTSTELETAGYTLSDFAGISRNISLSTWVVQHQTSNEVFDRVEFSNGSFIAVSKTPYERFVYSSVNGNDWTKISVTFD